MYQNAHNLSHQVSDYASVETLDYWPHQVILISLYSLIAAISFTLNSFTIAILLKCDKIDSELHVYLINLAVSDIVMSLLCIPFTYSSFILNRWIFPHFICPFVNFAQICSVLVSIWTLTLIGIERYIAIVNPLNSINKNKNNQSKYSRHRKKLLSVGIIWFGAICSGWIQFNFTRVVPVEYHNQTLFDCRENLPEQYSKLYTIYLFVSAFGLPLLILIYVYSIIGYKVWRHVTPSGLSLDQNNRTKVVKMLLLIVLLFFICWFPLQIFTLLVTFMDNFLIIRSDSDRGLLVYGYLVAHLLAMSHSLVNPIVYCLFSRQFSRPLSSHKAHGLILNCNRIKQQPKSPTIVMAKNSIVVSRHTTTPRSTVGELVSLKNNKQPLNSI